MIVDYDRKIVIAELKTQKALAYLILSMNAKFLKVEILFIAMLDTWVFLHLRPLKNHYPKMSNIILVFKDSTDLCGFIKTAKPAVCFINTAQLTITAKFNDRQLAVAKEHFFATAADRTAPPN